MFTPTNEIDDAVFSAAVVLQAVTFYREAILATEDPLNAVLMRYVKGETYYSKALGAMVGKLYTFVERAIANPDRYQFHDGQQRIIAAALEAYEQHQTRIFALHRGWMSEMTVDEVPLTQAYPQPRWADLNERFLALDS